MISRLLLAEIMYVYILYIIPEQYIQRKCCRNF